MKPNHGEDVAINARYKPKGDGTCTEYCYKKSFNSANLDCECQHNKNNDLINYFVCEHAGNFFNIFNAGYTRF